MSKRATILVIEDNAGHRELIELALSPTYEVYTAADAFQAVDLLTGKQIDLLIIDLGLPLMDGIEFIRKVRSYWLFNHVPILVVSAFTELSSRVDPLDVQAVLAKPFNLDELARVAEETIEAARRKRAAALPAPVPHAPLV